MTPLNTDQRERFRDTLHERERELRRRIHHSLVNSDNKDYAEMAGRVLDIGDQSMVDLLADANIITLENEVAELADVTAALGRIRDGSYGVCIDCGDEIVTQRLEVYPTARRCRDCQARHENQARDRSPSL
ncbi:MAG TPA: TraR/DksA C4-type zinc finger protein [Acidiferrobacterales bacterium]